MSLIKETNEAIEFGETSIPPTKNRQLFVFKNYCKTHIRGRDSEDSKDLIILLFVVTCFIIIKYEEKH